MLVYAIVKDARNAQETTSITSQAVGLSIRWTWILVGLDTALGTTPGQTYLNIRLGSQTAS